MTPALAYSGATGESSETFQLVLSNASGASIADDAGIATIIDDDSNNDPFALDDSATATSEVEQLIDVLANDSDPDGDPIAVESVESPTANGGSVVINPDNTLSYTSAPGFTGSDSFSYTIRDGQGGTATATVTIEVTEATDTAMFVAAISFQSRKGGREWRAIFEVRDEFGAAVSGASITVTFAGQTYSDLTDANGLFQTEWRSLSSGSYEAEVIDLALTGYTWDLTQGWGEESDDSDLYPDALLTF